MRQEFGGYYAPTEEEYKRLWAEGLIVLDTNVLLDLYRLPASARDEIISVLEIHKERLWIPYQVALEFQKRRLSVIASERKSTEDALSESSELFESISNRVNALQIDKRGLGLESQPLVESLKVANDKLIEAIQSVHRAQLDIAVSDPIRDNLDSLLAGRLGSPPSDQAELDSLTEDGERRYDNKIPPGFADKDKDKNPNEASYHHDGLLYQRKFGDLILWRQMMRHVFKNKHKVVLFVTADRKEDWWWREQGKTVGPRPELIREMKKIAGVELFWMYSSSQFLENAKRFTQAKISESSVTELEEVSRFKNRLQLTRFDSRLSASEGRNPPNIIQFNYASAEAAVQTWLVRMFGGVEHNRGFPDFLVATDAGSHGFEVKFARSVSQMLLSPGVINAMLRGYLEVNEGRLSRFSLILIADQDDITKIWQNERSGWVSTRLNSLLDRYPIHEIFVGFIDEEDDFVIALHEHRRDTWSDHNKY